MTEPRKLSYLVGGGPGRGHDDEWQLVKLAIGIDRGWYGAYRLVSSLDRPGQDIPQPD